MFKNTNVGNYETVIIGLKHKLGSSVNNIYLSAIRTHNIIWFLELFEQLRSVSLKHDIQNRILFRSEKFGIQIYDTFSEIKKSKFKLKKSSYDERLAASEELRNVENKINNYSSLLSSEKNSLNAEELKDIITKLQHNIWLPIIHDNDGQSVFITMAEGGSNIQYQRIPESSSTDLVSYLHLWFDAIDAIRKHQDHSFLESMLFDAPHFLGECLKWGEDFSLVKDSTSSNLCIIGNAYTMYLPLRLMHAAPENNTILLEDFNVSYVPSVTTLNALTIASKHYIPRKNITIIVNTTGTKYSDIETNIIDSFFGGENVQTICTNRVSKSTLIDKLKNSDYWHFVTHGNFVFHDADESFLELSEGEKLSIEDIAFIKKQQPTRLVTLSACETAYTDVLGGAQDEFNSFHDAFMSSGAIGIIGTLWPVFESATTFLMIKFYDLHISQNQEPAEALKNAQLWVRNVTNSELIEYLSHFLNTNVIDEQSVSLLLHNFRKCDEDEQPFRSPIFWGGFVLNGI